MRPLLRDLEDLLLGDVEQLVGRLRRRSNASPTISVETSISRRRSAFSLDDLRVVLDVRRRRHRVDEEADVVLAAARLELPAPLQLVGERERIDDARRAR